MELVVEDPDFRSRLTAPSYGVLQRSGITYWNTRLVRRDSGARYRGVTHEYVDVAGEHAQLEGVWYKDHASGSNRVDKFERDIRLLLAGLEQEPGNHRYQFYLAQSYRDAGRTQEAIEAYSKRAEMGGWDEEAWYSRLQVARCHRKLNNEPAFVQAALAAFNQRPRRAEPLYDLARHYRERGMNDASVLFSEAGLNIDWPAQDVLFIEEFIYKFGLREEFSIAANYARDPVRKSRGFAACDWLALSRDVPAAQRDLARHNLQFYVQPALELLPSFSARPLDFAPSDGPRTLNPSMAALGDQILVAMSANGDASSGVEVECLKLGADLNAVASSKHPLPAYGEISRLFVWRGEIWGLARRPGVSSGKPVELSLVRIDANLSGSAAISDARALPLGDAGLGDRGWMPLIDGDALRIVQSFDPVRVMDEAGAPLKPGSSSINADLFEGASPCLRFENGWLALVRETHVRDGRPDCWRRFVWLDTDFNLRRASRPFFFQARGAETGSGLAWHPDGKRLLVTYALEGKRVFVASMEAAEVAAGLVPYGGERLSEVGGESSQAGVAVERHSEANPSVAATRVKRSIPKLFHFITGLDSNFGGKPFSFVHSMAIRSALSLNPEFRAKVYYQYEPSGKYWDEIKGDVECVPVEAPSEIFGNPLDHFAHKADVLRMRIMLEQGGIYLDFDTISQRPFAPLLDGSVVMGREERINANGARYTVGLCNATMIAPPNAEFMRIWFDAYRSFQGGGSGDLWNKHSVQVPYALSKERPDLLRIEPAESFFWPSWDEDGLSSLFVKDEEFPDAYSFHLWEGASWRYIKEIDAESVKALDTSYNRIARRFVS